MVAFVAELLSLLGFAAGLLAFGAVLLAPPVVLLLSPSPLPPIWCSLWWVGLSWRCATAEALVLSWDLPWPCELSAASAGDVRANMRRTPAMRIKALTTNLRTSAGRLARKSPNVSNAHLPRGYERLPRRHPGHGPQYFRGYVAERPAQRSLVGQSLDMTTQTASLVTMEEATDEASVTAFVEELLGRSGWKIDAVRRRSSRLDPPDWYWTQFDITINKEGEEDRKLRLVAKGALNPEAWERLSERLTRHGAGRRCDPIDGIGYPCLFPESQHAYWFYPYDPTMPGLPAAADPVRVATLLLGLQDQTEDILAASRRVQIERVRYVPEVGAILRYRMDTPGARLDVYGKVQPGNRGLRTYRIVEGLWEAAKRYPGVFNPPP